jgi:hypothetical protein
MSRLSIVDEGGTISIVRAPNTTASVRPFNTAVSPAPAVVNVGSSFQYFVFNQNSPATTWNITHNLGRRPSVTVVDSAGTVVIGEVTYTSDNALTIQFSAGFSGQAYLN